MGCDVAGALAGQPEVYNLGAMIPELTLIVPFCAPAPRWRTMLTVN